MLEKFGSILNPNSLYPNQCVYHSPTLLPKGLAHPHRSFELFCLITFAQVEVVLSFSVLGITKGYQTVCATKYVQVISVTTLTGLSHCRQLDLLYQEKHRCN